ncbi:unnamed protein product [Ixodes persulcatus]
MPLAVLLPRTQKQCEYKLKKKHGCCIPSSMQAARTRQSRILGGHGCYPKTPAKFEAVSPVVIPLRETVLYSFWYNLILATLKPLFYGPNSPSCERYLLSTL